MKKSKIIVKNKETEKIEKLSPEEYRNIDDKIPLTIENLKKHNNTIKFGLLFLIIIIILAFITTSGLIFYNEDFNSINKTDLLLIIAITVVSLSIPVVSLTSIIRKNNKTKKYIDDGNFKIVEDKIYDKYFRMNLSSDNGATYDYYICTKIYGYQKIDSIIYDVCQKDDSIYYLMCNGNERNNEVIQNKQKEIKRNDENTYQQYLAIINPLSEELKKYFISYDETLGESNYKKRIEYRIDELKQKSKLNCKKCGEKNYLKNNSVCPKCGNKYEFDISDVIEYKDWL